VGIGIVASFVGAAAALNAAMVPAAFGAKVIGWGGNTDGQIGGAPVGVQTVPSPCADMNNQCASVAAGSNHSLILTRSHTVLAMGGNHQGQLGDGTTVNRPTPKRVSGLNNIVAVSAFGDHSLALKANGNVFAWGRNDVGQLGDGTTINRTQPVQVQELTNIAAIATGYRHSAAVGRDGRLYLWGLNATGQLIMAAVRGYIGDWDSFTLSRGKNGYMYRRWSDGKFMFLH
jgi:alpha-tubulin suppressor-like RCC1 family protein